ncbi:MAG: type II toxin-antitoxin system RelE/ParE family toxin [Clostridia bacterium]|nr:type II toxin-antitoxin system RelE/ParE family toxin [Clostridia bacterium]
MIREFIFTKPFLASWKAMGLDTASLKILEEILLENPHIGDVIQGTGGARKMRIQLDGRGKSGGSRVIYLDVFEKEKLYLLFAYPKNVQEDLTEEQKKAIKSLIDAIKKE